PFIRRTVVACRATNGCDATRASGRYVSKWQRESSVESRWSSGSARVRWMETRTSFEDVPKGPRGEGFVARGASSGRLLARSRLLSVGFGGGGHPDPPRSLAPRGPFTPVHDVRAARSSGSRAHS